MTIRRTCSSTQPTSDGTNGKYAVTCTGGDLNNGFEWTDCVQVFDANNDNPTNQDTGDLEIALGVSLSLKL